MKEPNNIVVSTVDPGGMKKKIKGGTSFNNLKQRQRRELRKKEQKCIQGKRTPTNFMKTGGEIETRASNMRASIATIPIRADQKKKQMRTPLA